MKPRNFPERKRKRQITALVGVKKEVAYLESKGRDIPFGIKRSLLSLVRDTERGDQRDKRTKKKRTKWL